MRGVCRSVCRRLVDSRPASEEIGCRARLTYLQAINNILRIRKESKCVSLVKAWLSIIKFYNGILYWLFERKSRIFYVVLDWICFFHKMLILLKSLKILVAVNVLFLLACLERHVVICYKFLNVSLVKEHPVFINSSLNSTTNHVQCSRWEIHFISFQMLPFQFSIHILYTTFLCTTTTH